MENVILEDMLNSMKKDNAKLLEHSSDVVSLSEEFGAYLGLSDDKIDSLRRGAYLHDIGKIRVRQDVLNKPGRLSKEEFDNIKIHPFEGYVILRNNGITNTDVLEITLQHHERHDGEGYPFGIGGHAINPLAKIVSLCDVYDALTSERCYKHEMAPYEAIDLIVTNLGTQFDLEMGTKFKTFIELKICTPKVASL